MSIFKLDPDSVSQRVTARGESPRMRSLWATVLQGALGFGLVGLLAFAVWAWGGRWLMSYVGKYGFYGEVAVAFIGLAGLALGRLVIGPGALARFYGLFKLGFVLYSIVWCAIYFTLPGQLPGRLGGKLGEIFGSAAGLAVLCLLLLGAFDARQFFLPCWGVFFLLATLGYYVGEPFHTWYPGVPGILVWGFCYGTGFGAGVGYVLYEAQSRTRELLSAGRDATIA